MAFEYAWLRILEALVRARRPMGVEELRQELGRFGFRFGDGALEDGLRRLQEQGLIEVLVLVGSGMESVAVTAKGERKVRGIVRL